MPQILRIGSYVVYFWSNEAQPLEYVHVHVASKRPTVDATKLWITSEGGVVVCNNDSQIPPEVLRKICALWKRTARKSSPRGYVSLAKQGITAKAVPTKRLMQYGGLLCAVKAEAPRS